MIVKWIIVAANSNTKNNKFATIKIAAAILTTIIVNY